MSFDTPTCRRGFVSLLLGAAASSVAAQAQPALRLVVTFGAGGISDIVTRLVAGPLAQHLGQSTLVENRPGAAGAIGARSVAQAAPDGHTLLMGTPATQVIAPMLQPQLGYDPWADFVPVSLLTEAPLVLATRPLPGVHDLEGLVHHARARPGQLSYASAGHGTTPHLAMAMFQLATGTRLLHVPYKSGGEAVAAVVGGTVDVVVEAATVLAPFVRGGPLQALCAAGPRRCALLPDLATATELGLQAFAVTAPWQGIAAPAGTPAARLAQLEQAVAHAMADAGLRQRLQARGIEVLPGGPAAYRALLAQERRDWSGVVQAAGIA